MSVERVTVPRFYQPYPYQQACWTRRMRNDITYYFKLWARQLGKDTDDIEYSLYDAWNNPGTQTTYIGLDNIWINNNIFKKYIDGREFWSDYPDEYIDPKDTAKEVYMLNNPKDKAQARIKFIGFLNDKGIIGSSYDKFYISEASLYPRNGFQYIEPIWDRKFQMGVPFHVNFNGTPRGMKNIFYDLLRTYTGVDDPDDFPGYHTTSSGKCYVDKVTIEDAMIPDGNGNYVPMYTKEEIEELRLRYIRTYGNDALFRQEHYCDFTTVNAGLVYRAIEQLQKENRYCSFNLDTSKPVYIAFDIASKGKSTDSTAAIIYQMINNKMMVYDIFEARSISLVEGVTEVSKRPYFHMIKVGFLPWDSENSASSMTPFEEAQGMFPNIRWHVLDRERVDRGIQLVRNQLPNMVINSDKCEWLLECFNNYEYARIERLDDWSAKPIHNKYSHMMDALRYAVMGISEMRFFQMAEDGSEKIDWNQTYGGFYDDEKPVWDKPYPEHWIRKEKRTDAGLYYL